MRHVRRLFGTTVLTLVLTQATLAGEGVVYPWYTPPPPPPPPTLTGTANPVQPNDSVKSTSEDGTVNLVTEVTLTLVQHLLALL